MYFFVCLLFLCITATQADRTIPAPMGQGYTEDYNDEILSAGQFSPCFWQQRFATMESIGHKWQIYLENKSTFREFEKRIVPGNRKYGLQWDRTSDVQKKSRRPEPTTISDVLIYNMTNNGVYITKSHKQKLQLTIADMAQEKPKSDDVDVEKNLQTVKRDGNWYNVFVLCNGLVDITADPTTTQQEHPDTQPLANLASYKMPLGYDFKEGAGGSGYGDGWILPIIDGSNANSHLWNSPWADVHANYYLTSKRDPSGSPWLTWTKSYSTTEKARPITITLPYKTYNEHGKVEFPSANFVDTSKYPIPLRGFYSNNHVFSRVRLARSSENQIALTGTFEENYGSFFEYRIPVLLHNYLAENGMSAPQYFTPSDMPVYETSEGLCNDGFEYWKSPDYAQRNRAVCTLQQRTDLPVESPPSFPINAMSSVDKYKLNPYKLNPPPTTNYVEAWCGANSINSREQNGALNTIDAYGNPTSCPSPHTLLKSNNMCRCFHNSTVAFGGQFGNCSDVMPATLFERTFAVNSLDAASDFVRTVTASDIGDFDICSGRGVVPEPDYLYGTPVIPPFGPVCKCDLGWFGSQLFMNIYASQLFPSSDGDDVEWVDENATMRSYALTHQCLFWQGDSSKLTLRYKGGYGRNGALQVPTAPFKCSDGLFPKDPSLTTLMRGGGQCLQCPDCNRNGTETCDTVIPHDWYSNPVCFCKPAFGGDLCELETCPTPGGAHSLPCSGHGVCYRALSPESFDSNSPNSFEPKSGDPFFPFTSTANGMCVCHDGFGGANGDCTQAVCPVNATDGRVCGTHGSCKYSNCTTALLPDASVGRLAAYKACYLKSYTTYSLCVNLCQTNSDGGTDSQCNKNCIQASNSQFKQCGTEPPEPEDGSGKTITWSTACSVGECICDAGWILDDKGACSRRQCALDPVTKLECSGLVISAGSANAGKTVCDGDPIHPTCDCWKAMAAANPWSQHADGRYNEKAGVAGTCSGKYAIACTSPSHPDRYCSNHGGDNPPSGSSGSCYPAVCVSGSTWADCHADPNAEPVCHCDAITHGKWCEFTLCGDPGVSSNTPCTLGKQNLFETGVCEPPRGSSGAKCSCTVNPTAAYNGDNCEHNVTLCAPVFGTSLCGGHGTCVKTGADAYCDCATGYSGAKCETSLSCGGLCPPERGTCPDNECTCFEAYSGTNCVTDACAATGGLLVDSHTCNCDAVDGVQYTKQLHGGPPTTFRGCAKKCAIGTNENIPGFGLECNGLGITIDAAHKDVSRCDHVVAANGASAAPSCDCSGLVRNTAVNQVMPAYTSSDGSCAPVCAHCNKTAGGLCTADSCARKPCQYEGTQCATLKCTDPDARWDGSRCNCRLQPWLYKAPGDCNTNNTVCGPAPYSVAPDVSDLAANKCQCLHPLEASSTGPECVSVCGPNGNPNFGAATCDCDVPFIGKYCNERECPEYAPNAYAITDSDGNSTWACDCRALSQWSGRKCDVSNCHGGTPRAGSSGCDCWAQFSGLNCEHDLCLNGGNARLHGNSVNCNCPPGYIGSTCETSLCTNNNVVIKSISAATDLGYTCSCGSIATFDSESGRCVDFNCDHGTIASVVVAETPYCRCDDEWSGLNCDQHSCDFPEFEFLSEAGDCKCRPDQEGSGVGACAKAKVTTCKEWLDAIEGRRSFSGDNPVSVISVPVNNPAPRPTPTYQGIDCCICNDTRYKMFGITDATYVSCTLRCDQRFTIPHEGMTPFDHDVCDCKTDPVTGVPYTGTLCDGVIRNATTTPGTPAQPKDIPGAHGSGAFNFSYILYIAVAFAVMGCGFGVWYYFKVAKGHLKT